MTLARVDVRSFLGGRNFKGLYTRNPLATTPAYAKFNRRKAMLTSFKVRPRDRQGPLVNWPELFKAGGQAATQPFEHNKYTKSNRLVSAALRSAIVADSRAGESAQALSFKYGLSVLRVEAVLKLDAVHSEMAAEEKITKEMSTMAKHMRKLFATIPVNENGVPTRPVDDLTEIPVAKETRNQRFLSIAESEPFGPIDAAAVLGIEPAARTLEKLTQVDGDAAQEKAATEARPVSFIAPQMEGDRALFRFTDAKVGNVGFRYGASRDDRKHGRRVRFLPDGRRTYPLPEHS